MKIRGKNYELVKVYKDPRFEEKDMLLCRSEIGYLECFHRFDLNDQELFSRKGIHHKSWAQSEIEFLRQEAKSGKYKSPIDLAKSVTFEGRTWAGTYERIKRINKKEGCIWRRDDDKN